LSVTIVERGDFLPREPDNWNPKAVYVDKKYTARETWFDAQDKPFNPSIFYNVGGASKFFGATMIRFRERDFQEVEHFEGVSPAWPISYSDLEPYYQKAERLYHTHGTSGIDPSEAWRSEPFPHSGVQSDPALEFVVEKLRLQGIHPFPQQAAIHLPPQGHCVRCGTCDGYPCKIDAKADAEISTVRPAIATGKVKLLTKTLARRILLSPDGRSISGIEVERDGAVELLQAKTYILSASAINSAALLLRSATEKAANGVANSSGVVGRHYMAHNNSALMAVSPFINPTVFQKTITINDWYWGDSEFKYPMGCIISLGKLRPGVMTAANPLVPHFVNKLLADRSFDWWVMSEDLPDPENRVSIKDGHIKLSVKRNNLRAHLELTKRISRALRRAGLPLILTKLMPPAHDVASMRHGPVWIRSGNGCTRFVLSKL
jgi:choline dehydrogenase-like flavoprotein